MNRLRDNADTDRLLDDDAAVATSMQPLTPLPLFMAYVVVYAIVGTVLMTAAPAFERLYSEYKLDVPWATAMVLRLGHWFRGGGWWMLLPIPVVLPVLHTRAARAAGVTPSPRRNWRILNVTAFLVLLLGLLMLLALVVPYMTSAEQIANPQVTLTRRAPPRAQPIRFRLSSRAGVSCCSSHPTERPRMSQVHALQIHDTAISEPLAVPAYAAPTPATGEPPAGAPTPPVEATRRLVSLDAFRGITIAAMLLVNNPGHGRAYDALEHVEWHGWTLTDLIFPFFLFIVGVAIPFSMAKRSALAPLTRGQQLGRVWLRALSLFMLGALLTASSVAGISVNLGTRTGDIPVVEVGQLGDGHTPLKILRVAAWTFTICGVFALLIPYRSRKLQVWVPIGITIGFLILIFAVGFANRSVWPAGPPADVHLGGGILRPSQFRIPGVLQRIGICYGVAGTIAVFFGRRMIFAALVALLALYSAIMLAAPIHNAKTGEPIHWYSPDRLTKQDNVARRVDEAVFDRWTVGADGRRVYQWHHTYAPYPDNEGLLSTIPAIGTVLLGILVGLWLRTDRTAAERAGGMMAWGAIVAVLGWCLDAWLMPINKNLWTPSYVLLTGGLGMLGLGAMFWQIDVNRRRRWAWPLVVYGMNAIAAFVAASLLSKILGAIKFPIGEKRVSLGAYAADQSAAAVHQFNDWLHHLSPHVPDVATPANTSLAFALLFVLTVFVLMLVLYVCRIFVKV